MKKRLLALSFVFVFLLAGCGKEEAKKKVTPTSEVYADDTSSEETTEKESAVKYEASGGDSIFESLMEDMDSENKKPSQVTKGDAPSTLDTPWNAVVNTTLKGGAQTEADNLRSQVLKSSNTAKNYTWTGRTFYVSPDGDDKNDGLTPQTAIQSMNARAVLKSTLKAGDAILFERGGVWRMTTSISTKGGVIYGCYGDESLEKPTFMGSPYNYANADYWTPSTRANIWKLNIADADIGLVVFNNGSEVGYKRLNGLTALDKNNDFYYNTKEDILYLYCDKGNPGKVYNDIEVCLAKNGFSVGGNGTIIDNVRIKYYGTFGIGMCGNNNTTITNCEIGFIGGAIQSGTTRYGNGIQQWNSTDTLTISNCWVYQTYDTAITFQGNDTYEVGQDANGNDRIGDKAYYKNITFSGNLLEYNIISYEIWHHQGSGVKTLCQVKDFKLTDNICRFSGYCWSTIQRPDKVGYGYYGSQDTWFQNASGCEIKNNIFDVAARCLVYWTFSDTSIKGFTISDNTFYHSPTKYGSCVVFGTQTKDAGGQADLIRAVTIFDAQYAKAKFLTE